MSNPKYTHALTKYVSVKLADGKVFEGYLKTIDPCTETLVLTNYEDSKLDSYVVINKSAISDVIVVREAEPEISAILKQPFESSTVQWNTSPSPVVET